ncbi:MAG: PEP/pyruvate-binding domain-containing protein [Candidatus Cloacimonetes bacterium]|nr:PEP/pyruvate-binding domain-containing protein [Candidatus Cloacimonadota bacterium]MCF7812920.1 PEP/pyruvate-binding domain-containing protein [Candidatus Cloacimonadota bacterium]MCF7867132.1 PEP/pyruvate-binding domain-containing protein [Candidatus Cloacimonadota bacterium]MCF7882548.1 PEP/pyruvate-binding domain-containing protein [Candidatus Cloacimonadota bacterium]
MQSGTEFSREKGFFNEEFNYIGTGLPGGKATGLAQSQEILKKHFPDGEISGMKINIPATTVLLSDVFDDFMESNDLYEIALSDASDEDIAISFINSSFGGIYAGDLYYLIENIKKPLAIRSSSICEDSLKEPFAGVYETKMVANNQFTQTDKYNALINAVKFVYASLFFQQSKDYFRTINRDIKEEKMGIIIQEVIGDQFENNFHPAISGVLKSYNFYPSDSIKPDAGFAALAFGLGKTIVDGSSCWSYCPRFPRTPQPFNNMKDLLNNTQKKYWTINLGNIDNHNPVAETEYLMQNSIFEIQDKFQLKNICSTYDFANDRLIMGIQNYGAPVLDFAPTLRAEMLPLNTVINKIMQACEEETGNKVEIEFAVSIGQEQNPEPRFGFLQLRPINISNETVEIPEKEIDSNDILLSSKNAMGNGISKDIFDIVFIRPDTFEIKNTQQIAKDVAEINALFYNNKRKYLLIGFGRWGTSDPWCGIPVQWSQISNAKAIVETVLPSMRADFSQGAHFFHNMTAHNVFYFSVNEEEAKNLDWDWIDRQKTINETKYVKHVRLPDDLKIMVDGRKSVGIILKK